MRFFYDDAYNYGSGLPIRRVHGFVLDKPRRIRDALVSKHGVGADAFESPEELDDDDFARVHLPDHMAMLGDQGRIADAIEMPAMRWLPNFMVQHAVVRPQMRASGGTLTALRAAAEGAWTANLSGGYHHARPDLAHGFCLVNDVAVAVRRLRSEGVDPRVMVIDLDLHQGDGNAISFQDDPQVFTLSVHEQGIFPQPNAESDLDLCVPSHADDELYLRLVQETLDKGVSLFRPDVVIYVAGSDPYEADPLGTLNISLEGLRARDEAVGRLVQQTSAGLVALPAGGYTDASPLINAAGFAAIAGLK